MAANVHMRQQLLTTFLQRLPPCQAGTDYLHSQEFQTVLTPLTWQTCSATSSSHTKLVK